MDDAAVSSGLYAAFRAGGRLMALEAGAIDGIIKPPPVTPVPGAKDSLVGVINLRGEIVALSDLAAVLGLRASEYRAGDGEGAASGQAAGDQRRILVVSLGGEPAGLLVDAVYDVVSATPESLKDAPPNLRGGEERWFSGALDCQLGLAGILDLSAVLAAC
jgi:purine-binding chemotaxis protein CheW